MKRRFSARHMVLAAIGGALAGTVTLVLCLWLAVGPRVLSLTEAWRLVNTRFVGEYDPDKVVDYALSGMVQGVEDRWSYYLNAEDYEAQNQRRDNVYEGIGVTVGYSDDRGLLIQKVQPGTPAQEAGLEPGEVIVEVDGFSLAGEGKAEGVERILGEPGTPLTLVVLAADGSRREVTLSRAKVETSSVSGQVLPDGTGYVKVSDFYSHSGQQMKDMVDSLVEQGAVRLVFDMRNNGGGFVHELTEILDYLLPEGAIFRSEDKGGKEKVTYSDEGCIDLPMATLVNGDTYSAAEFFAAQLQETVGAPIIGEPTSGKGYSQQALPLPNGGALNLSTGRYRTGNGVSLIGTGVSLDVEVKLDEEAGTALLAGTLEPEADAQLQAAVEKLK